MNNNHNLNKVMKYYKSIIQPIEEKIKENLEKRKSLLIKNYVNRYDFLNLRIFRLKRELTRNFNKNKKDEFKFNMLNIQIDADKKQVEKMNIILNKYVICESFFEEDFNDYFDDFSIFD